MLGRVVSDTTLRARRDEWVDASVFDRLATEAVEAYDRVIGLDFADCTVDGSQHKAPAAKEPAPHRSIAASAGGSGRCSPTATAFPSLGSRLPRTGHHEHQQQQFRLTHALTYRRQDKQAGISPPLTISGNLGPPVIDQLALARLLASGAYDRQLRLLRRRYRARRDALTAADHGVAMEDVAPLRAGGGGPPALVLGYTRLPEHRITQAVQLLANAAATSRPHVPSSTWRRDAVR